jgi:hypothetical protein
MPELSLNEQLATEVSECVLKKHIALEFVSCGVLATSEKGTLSNAAYTRIRDFNHTSFQQDKHHRWRLDKNQVMRYGLGATLDPEQSWWENADISERECHFWSPRPHIAMMSVVCEDLARVDPVQPIIKAVAPNLLIALLMDGPQIEKRWPGLHARGLAEDVGCTVLSITSLGMIKRDTMAGDSSRAIALLTDYSGKSTQIDLPEGAAAVAISLSTLLVNDATASGNRRETDECVRASKGAFDPNDNRSRKYYLSAKEGIFVEPAEIGENTMFKDLKPRG